MATEFFTLEALPARFGDCLLLHFGTDGTPGLVLIDGGPSRVWTKSLSKRLTEVKEDRGDDFRIDLLMVSHIDDDHVVGIVEFTAAWKAAKQAGKQWLFPVDEVWHNSFERIANNDGIGDAADDVTASTGAQTMTEIDPDEHDVDYRTRDEACAGFRVLASVAKGKALRDDLVALGVPTNTGFDGNLVRPGHGPSIPYKLGDELTFRVCAPLPEQLEELQEKFAEDLPPEAALAAYADESVPNLSSIAGVASYKGKTMLLTGDARGDYLRDGLRAEGLLGPGDKLHVDIFKLPHHGSDRNIDIDFFQQITADHYVASADGTYGNPDRPTLEMLINARPKTDVYTIHLTYPLAEIDARRKEVWAKDRARELKAEAKAAAAGKDKPARAEWNDADHSLAELFKTKQAAGHKFVWRASPAAQDGAPVPTAKIDLLDAIPF